MIATTLRRLTTGGMLAVALLALLAAPVALAVPEYCWYGCTSSTPCSSICWDTELQQTTTCGVWGVCDRSSCSCSSYVYGTSGADTLNGNAYNNCIYGYGGADTLYGQGGGDKLFGDAGNDTLYGGSGDDCLYGGSDSDHLDGGTGTDTCREGEAYVSCEQ